MSNNKPKFIKFFEDTDIKILESNTVVVRYSADEYEQLLKQAKETGFSLGKIVFLKSSPCQSCGCDNVTITIAKTKPHYKRAETKPNILQQRSNNGQGHNDIV